MHTLAEIEARLAEIGAELETRGAELTEEEINGFEKEVKELKEERAKLEKNAEKRAAMLADIAAGKTPTATLRAFGVTPQPEQKKDEDATNSTEYRTAFMNYVCRGVAIPAELRAAASTGVEDAGAVIPTTIVEEIVTKLESYGNLYAGFRKLNVQGGVKIPIADIKPVAKWVGEGASDDQKLSAKEGVTFNYYGLECKLAQSLLVNVTTIAAFQQLFVSLATEAMVKAIEIAAINGDGEGKPLGVTKDTRVTNKVELTEAQAKTWAGWHKVVKSKIKKAYRDGVFIMNQSTYDGYIDGMVDDNGQPVGRTNYGIDGAETYRFMGKTVETVEDDVIPAFDDAEDGDVIGVYMRLSDYAINSNMQMTATNWVDNDNNKIKNKLMLIVDGKAVDTNGIIIIKKKVSA